jgi:hypothetical protein
MEYAVTTSPHTKVVEELSTRAEQHANAHGATLCVALEVAVGDLLLWLDYLETSESTGSANILLSSIKSAIREAAGCLSLGLVRPAIFAIRTQIDLLLAWLYFKDHPVEWGSVQSDGENFLLRKDVLEYLSRYYPLFKKRRGLLTQAKTRSLEDPYHVLSAHIHGKGAACVPSIDALSDMVIEIGVCNECVSLQSECAEYLSDILWALFAEKWKSVPVQLTTSIKNRLSNAQQNDFFPVI